MLPFHIQTRTLAVCNPPASWCKVQQQRVQRQGLLHLLHPEQCQIGLASAECATTFERLELLTHNWVAASLSSLQQQWLSEGHTPDQVHKDLLGKQSSGLWESCRQALVYIQQHDTSGSRSTRLAELQVSPGEWMAGVGRTRLCPGPDRTAGTPAQKMMTMKMGWYARHKCMQRQAATVKAGRGAGNLCIPAQCMMKGL